MKDTVMEEDGDLSRVKELEKVFPEGVALKVAYYEVLYRMEERVRVFSQRKLGDMRNAYMQYKATVAMMFSRAVYYPGAMDLSTGYPCFFTWKEVKFAEEADVVEAFRGCLKNVRPVRSSYRRLKANMVALMVVKFGANANDIDAVLTTRSIGEGQPVLPLEI